MIRLNRIVSIVSWHCLCHEHTFPNWFTSLWGVYPLNWLASPLLRNLGFEANPTMIRVLSTDQLNNFSSSSSSFSFAWYISVPSNWQWGFEEEKTVFKVPSNWSKKVSSSRLYKLCQVERLPCSHEISWVSTFDLAQPIFPNTETTMLSNTLSQIFFYCRRFDHILVSGQATENWKVGADEDQLQVLENTKQERKGGLQYQDILREKIMFVFYSD